MPFMQYLSSALMGLLQGVTEFLPVSSSGHLSLFQNFFGGKEPDNLFNVLLHFATLITVCLVYRRDIGDMILEFFRGCKALVSRDESVKNPPPARRLVLMLILGTLPLFVILPFKSKVEALGSSTLFIGCALLVTGVILFSSDRFARGRKDAKTITVADALFVAARRRWRWCPGSPAPAPPSPRAWPAALTAPSPCVIPSCLVCPPCWGPPSWK